MSDPPPNPSANRSTGEDMFPTLTEAQIARVAANGRLRHVRQGEVLIEAGERTAWFFVVTAGQIEIVQPTGETEEVVAVFRPGMFTGEVTMLSGRRALARTRE